MRIIVPAVLATALLTASASAADTVPADPSTKQQLKPGQGLVGSIDYAQDIDWIRLVLTPGENYLAALDEYDNGVVSEIDIYDAKKRLVGRQADENVDDFGGGYARAVKFIAPSNPLYLAYKLRPAARGSTFPDRYAVSLRRSCAHNTKTKCVAQLGASHTSDLGSLDDANWYRIALQTGRTYALYGAYGKSFACDPDGRGFWVAFGLADPAGKIVLKPQITGGTDPDDGSCTVLEDLVGTYKVPRTGTYFVIVQAGGNDGVNERGSFTLKAVTGTSAGAQP